MKGNTLWKPKEVIALAIDCVNNGIKAVSLGGGEPFEYDGIFQIIDAIQPLAYLSITTNGLPLLEKDVWQALLTHKPDKIHITIHNPDNDNEVQRVFEQIKNLSEYNRENETCTILKRNEQIFSFFASFFLLLFRPLKHHFNAD